MGKGSKKDRRREREDAPAGGTSRPSATSRSSEKPRSSDKPHSSDKPRVPLHLAPYAHAAPLTGAKKIKKKCCRSAPRCKGCPVLLMRAARLHDAGVSGKDLKKALKKARAA